MQKLTVYTPKGRVVVFGTATQTLPPREYVIEGYTKRGVPVQLLTVKVGKNEFYEGGIK